MKFKKAFKKSLCIFLSVMMLFFGVNNSYFSPHKMDNVEATGAVIVGGVTITVSMIIKLIAAIGITGLSCAVIDNIKDWDWEQIAIDLHDWCKENYDAIASYLASQPALKRWVLADEWVVVVDTASGGDPQPSPSPDDDEESENLPSTGTAETGLTTEEFESLLNDHHGFTNAFRLTAGALAGGFGLSSILAPISYIAEYGHYVDEEGNVIPDDDPRIRNVSITESDEDLINIAKAYVNDKIVNYQTATPEAGTDPFTESLQSIYGYEDGKPHYFGSLLADSDGIYTVNCSGSYHYSKDQTVEAYFTAGYRPFVVVASDFSSLSAKCCYLPDEYPSGYSVKWSGWRYYGSGKYSIDSYSLGVYGALNGSWSVSCPMFLSTDTDGIQAYVANGNDSSCINREREHNYIDTSDEYGWASTADLSPADLAQANPALANDLIGKDVSISSLVAAINALKKQLEDQNPNTSTGGVSADPVPYPDVPTYTVIVNEVVSDPDIFPETNPGTSTDPGTDPGTSTDPDAETGKDYAGLLGTIIGLLQQILQAIKDFMSWFVIDFPAIKAHLLEALDNVPGADGLDPFLAIITDIKGQITDHYDYPKITIQTPEILVQFVKAPEIVLLDFKDYAEYFIWVRTAMAFAILFGFAMWCVRDIKVELTLN